MNSLYPLGFLALMLVFLGVACAADLISRLGRRSSLHHREGYPPRMPWSTEARQPTSLAADNQALVQLLTKAGFDAPLIKRLRNEADINSVRDLALTLDDPRQDASFAVHFGLTGKQVRRLAQRSGAGLPAKRPHDAVESVKQRPQHSPTTQPVVAATTQLVRLPKKPIVLARNDRAKSSNLAHA